MLTNPTGTLWSVAGLNEQNLTDKMDPYDVRKRLPDATVTRSPRRCARTCTCNTQMRVCMQTAYARERGHRLLDAEANSAEFTTALPEMEADTEDRERVQVRLSASTLAALLAEGGPTSTQRAADWVAYQVRRCCVCGAERRALTSGGGRRAGGGGWAVGGHACAGRPGGRRADGALVCEQRRPSQHHRHGTGPFPM